MLSIRMWFKDKIKSSPLVKEAGFSLLLKISQAGFSFLATVLLARILGAEGYGIYSYAFALVTLFSMPAQAGLPQLVIRETAKGMAEGRPELVKGIWKWATKLVFFISLILALFMISILLILKGNKIGLKEQTFLWALLLIPFMCLGNLRGAALQGLYKVILGQLPEFFIRPFLFLTFICIAGLFMHQKLSPSEVMAFHVFSAVIAFIIGAWLLYHNIPLNIRKAKVLYEKDKWLKSWLPLTFLAGMWVINSQVDIVMLGLLRPSDEVGVYRVAVQIAMLSSFGLYAVNSVVAPRFATFYAQKNMAELQKTATRSAQLATIFNFSIILFFAIFGKFFLRFIFGKEFVSGYTPLLILFLGQLVNCAVGSVGLLLNMTGHEKYNAGGIAFAAGINIILNLLLIPSLGANGAAIATSASMMIWNILLWWFVKIKIGINSLILPRF